MNFLVLTFYSTFFSLARKKRVPLWRTYRPMHVIITLLTFSWWNNAWSKEGGAGEGGKTDRRNGSTTRGDTSRISTIVSSRALHFLLSTTTPIHRMYGCAIFIVFNTIVLLLLSSNTDAAFDTKQIYQNPLSHG